MPVQAIDPTSGTAYALTGRLVTMDDARPLLEHGALYVRDGRIHAVLDGAEPPPPGFESATRVATGGTVYPGLVELHNHLSYNILPMWQVPRRFDERGQWKGHPEKRRFITGPMQVLGKTPGYVEAIARYVEAKCLVAGVTTSQGITLYGTAIERCYRGIVRNVEQPGDAALPAATTRVDDVPPGGAEGLRARLADAAGACHLLHLAEGLPEAARDHFLNLLLDDGTWAITPALAGIHSLGLSADDLGVMAAHGGAVVWSPLSNLLLYGRTLDLRAVKDAGLRLALGSDWSPSGSKNLLGELKVARLTSVAQGDIFSSAELVTMVTRGAAAILGWQDRVGSLRAGLLADLVVLRGRAGDPYDELVGARESDVKLTVIDGVPRYGMPALMSRFVGATEDVTVGGGRRVLSLTPAPGDDVVGALSLGDARDRLAAGLGNLAALARRLEDPSDARALAGLGADAGAGGGATWFLSLELDADEEQAFRRNLARVAAGDSVALLEPLGYALPYSELLSGLALDLDPLTIVDDGKYFPRLLRQPTLPDYLREGLPPLYGASSTLPDDRSFLDRVDPTVRGPLAASVDLAAFRRAEDNVTLEGRRRIVDQALLLFDQVYVHLPQKRATHAVDPVQRLRLLQLRLDEQVAAAARGGKPPREIAFHEEVTRIFSSVRDLHTDYLLPSPYRDRTAFLPFMVETYDEDGEPRYVISKVLAGAGEDVERLRGLEVLFWNGVPIHRAVELNADRQAGSNPAARLARGLDALTIRPLVRVLPPDEDWVTLRCRTSAGEEVESTHVWRVFPPDLGLGYGGADMTVAAQGIDLQTDAIHQVKKALFAPGAVRAEVRIAADLQATAAVNRGEVATTMPTVFRARSEETPSGTFAYIRIFTFNVGDADAFVAEFARLARALPQEGLIVDVRGNGGGLIYAAEQLLQALGPDEVEPEPAQFINTPMTLEICERNSPSRLWSDFTLEPWIDSIRQAVQTGETYSQAFPITPRSSLARVEQAYFGPVVLVTDALCYSATDMFVAGFQDAEIGPVLGTSANTGAGGANVWTHTLLRAFTSDPRADPPRPSPFEVLPLGAEMRVAARRTLRVGKHDGTAVEDLGVTPDSVHALTRRDLMTANADLIARAGALLAAGQAYALEPGAGRVEAGDLVLEVRTRNLAVLDLYLDDRPLDSQAVRDGANVLRVALPARGDPDPLAPLALRLEGLARRTREGVTTLKRVAVRRLRL